MLPFLELHGNQEHCDLLNPDKHMNIRLRGLCICSHLHKGYLHKNQSEKELKNKYF